MSLYDPERDRVRLAGRWLRWSLGWVAVPAALGIFLSGNVDVHALPMLGPERETAVLFQDGQAYFGHLDDSGEGGTLVLRDAYYFADAKGAPTGLSVGLVKRGAEAHAPADGMRINRDRVLALEQVGPNSSVAVAIQAERDIDHETASALSLNRISVGGTQVLMLQRTAAEHDIQRGYAAATDQLAKLNDLVLPVTKAEAQAISQKAIADLQAVRRNALAALALVLGANANDAQAYANATDAILESQTLPNEPAVLLAPDLNSVVSRATQLYTQVGDVYAKQLTQPKTASPSPSPTPVPSARP